MVGEEGAFDGGTKRMGLGVEQTKQREYLSGRMSPFLVAVAIGWCVVVAGCTSKQEPVAAGPMLIQVTTVIKRDLPLSREFVGRTVGAVDAEVRARVQGVLLEQHFVDGTEVQEGQLLYSIDQAPFLAKLAAAKGQLAEAQTKLVQASSDLARIEPLAAIDAVSKRELEASVAAKGVAEGAVQAAQAAVEAATIELGYTQVKAPVTGTIGISKVKVGEVVGAIPNAIILNIVSKLEPIHVQFTVSEREYLYFARLAQEQGEARVKSQLQLVLADGSTHPYKGEVVKIDRGIDAASGAITVEAAFPNPKKLLRPGLFAKIITVAETRRDVLLVPKKAIKEIQGTYAVFVVDPQGKVEQRTVQVGPNSGESQVIESGIENGEVIAVDGIQRLRSGMVIAPKHVPVS
jgi:membrane fusion protein (multidrug efflux system)